MAILSLTINGERRSTDIDPSTPLLWVLRDSFGLTGTKYGCGIAQCGACTVMLDGDPVRSCVTPVSRADGKVVTTIEGLSTDAGHPVQRAWLEEQVAQCGYCQSGQMMSAVALLSVIPKPTDLDIDRAMSGNICRCGTYERIRRAIHRAAALTTVIVACAISSMFAIAAHAQSDPENLHAFAAIAAVMRSPRCANCHIAGDAPLQGEDGHPHTMNVRRGADGRGAPGMRCRTCHQDVSSNVPHTPPGGPDWRLPPPATPMAWRGLTIGEQCRMLKDRSRNGERGLVELLEHVRSDRLVMSSWNAGPGRAAPPLSHDLFVRRFQEWIDGGAVCPQ